MWLRAESDNTPSKLQSCSLTSWVFLLCEGQHHSSRGCVCVLLSHATLICCHICVSWLLGDMAVQAPCVCLSAFLSGWQKKRSLVKGCDSTATYRGRHPQDPRGWTIQYCTTHTQYLQRGTGVLCYMSNVFVTPSPAHHVFSSIFCLFSRSLRISKQMGLNRDINEINNNTLRHWQACKLKGETPL